MSMYDEPMNKFTGDYQRDLNNQQGKLNTPGWAPPRQIYPAVDRTPSISFPSAQTSSRPSQSASSPRYSPSAIGSSGVSQSAATSSSSIGIGTILFLIAGGLIAAVVFLKAPENKQQPAVVSGTVGVAPTAQPGPVEPVTTGEGSPPSNPEPIPESADTQIAPIEAGAEPGTLTEPNPGITFNPAVPLSATNYERRITGARHQLRARRDCHGDLLFSSDAFRFDCQSDREAPIIVERSQVAGPDDNGVQLLKNGESKGKKYHFAVDGWSNNDVHNLFSQWYGRQIL